MQDQLGSTTALTDPSGNVVEREQHDAFGGGPISGFTRYGFAGRERDPDTGLIFCRYRWYDPAQGRFISEDPIGFAGGLNGYLCAGDDPIDLLDPLGLQDGPKNWLRDPLSANHWIVNGLSNTVSDVLGLDNVAEASWVAGDSRRETTDRILARTDGSGETQYTFDARGRLTGAALPGGSTVAYGYDALGRRSSRTDASGTTRFLYDAADIAVDKNPDGGETEYINGAGIDTKLRMSSPSGPLYFLQDHLKSTIGLLDATGAQLERDNYDPFGNSPGGSLTRYGFTGREKDNATGLMYFRFRWYDPRQGRFISEDPAGFAGGLDLYAYAGDDPIGFDDPFGLLTAPSDVADGIDRVIDRVDPLGRLGVPVTEDPLGGIKIAADLLRTGQGSGNAYWGHGKWWQKALGVTQDVCRVATIVTAGTSAAGIASETISGTAEAAAVEAGEEAEAGAAAAKPCKANVCFVGGTPVKTPDGEVPIEQLKPGDQVLSASPEGGKPMEQTVTRTFQRSTDAVLDIKVADETITCTPSHPFWVEGQGWVAARDLAVGSRLVAADGTIVPVRSVQERRGSFRVYNLEVGSLHAYYVGLGGLLVHNQCQSGPGGGGPGPGEYLAGKAPRQVRPGVRELEGNYVNDQSRVQPWKAYYDEYGRLIGRTDYNAGNKAAGIPDVHSEGWEYNDEFPIGRKVYNHAPGEYKP